MQQISGILTFREVHAAGDYVTVHAAGKSHLVRDSLRNIEARLVAKDSGDHEVVLHDGTLLRPSRAERARVTRTPY